MSDSESSSAPIDSELTPTPGAARLRALDVFRGLSVAGMILVNNSGGPAYAPLRHAEWDGLTPTDLVFPFFVFIVGVSITLALTKRVAEGASKRSILFKVFRRSAVIFGIGLFLALSPSFDNWQTIRIPGVLQRLALCYLFGSLIFLPTKPWMQAAIATILLVGYYLAMTMIPVGSLPPGDLSKEGNLAAHIDRTLLKGHIYRKEYDPEGILSTIPAIATTLLGILTGHWLRTKRTVQDKTLGLFAAGSAALIGGYFWSLGFPINKALWSSSFVLVTAGLAIQTLALCIWLIDLKGYKRWSSPFMVFGGNPLVAYVLAGLLARALSIWMIVAPNGEKLSARAFFVSNYLTPYMSTMNASLAYAILFVFICFLVVGMLHLSGVRIRA